MDVFFDGCTEVLLKEIMASSPEVNAQGEELLKQLPEFRKECVKDVCPAGELIRGWACRSFLRDAWKKMNDKLKSIDEDALTRIVMKRTEEYIESLGEETEAERAYIVVRNLIVIAENIAKQMQKQKLPNLKKQPLQMIHYHIDLKGLKEFEGITGFTWEKNIQNLLKLKTGPVMASCENRYRHMFYNLLVRLVTIRETEEGGKAA